MESNSYQRYAEESALWLHKGRQKLISYLLAELLPQHFDRQLLEIGAGVGQNIDILKDYGHVDALEINEIGLSHLRNNPNIRDIFPVEIPATLPRRYDVIGAFDVIEHINNDRQAVSWIFDNLNQEGLFIATFPAYSWLFTDHDRSLGHFRRYTLREMLTSLLPPEHDVIYSSYFNTTLFPLAVVMRFFWQIKQKISNQDQTGKQAIPSFGLINSFFHKILNTEAWLIKRGWKMPYGLSIIVCIRKTAQPSQKKPQ